MNYNDYAVSSLELHLFFGRIMKEHALFLKAGFTPVNTSFSQRAEYFKNEFEKLLSRAITLSDGIIGHKVLKSDELVTDFTALAEKQTEQFTGISINKNLTQRELKLRSGCSKCNHNISTEKYRQVKRLNRTALNLLDGLITFKENILNNVLNCRMFTMNYPLLIEHIIREAKLYRKYVSMLEENGCLSEESMKEIECFWNKIMMEHAMFIRGLLDPSEAELFNSADSFAKNYSKLLETCHKAQAQTMTDESLSETIKFRDFKQAGTQGIEQCKIRSVILPLLADHVLREANHYIRLLKS
ncbi:MAG: DUF2935 domain-containing protein [Clostridia bacterium]|nr:DUF2935 domain-containing protein [Clostridia bacterium]